MYTAPVSDQSPQRRRHRSEHLCPVVRIQRMCSCGRRFPQRPTAMMRRHGRDQTPSAFLGFPRFRPPLARAPVSPSQWTCDPPSGGFDFPPFGGWLRCGPAVHHDAIPIHLYWQQVICIGSVNPARQRPALTGKRKSRRTRGRVTAVLPKGCVHMFLDDHQDDQSLETGARAVATNFDPTLIATRPPRSRHRTYMSWVALGALALTCTASPRRAWPHTLTRTATHGPGLSCAG